jgi:phage terminase small subunit
MPKAKTPSIRLDEDGLNWRERVFTLHYLAHPEANGTEAARAAGYKDPSHRAIILLREPRVMKVIARERKKVLSDLDVKVERVIKELARVAFFDPRSLFDRNGMLKPIPQLTADAAAPVCGFDFRRTAKHGAISRIRLVSKLAALETLGRYLNLWSGKGDDEDDRLDEVVDAIRNSPAGTTRKPKKNEEDD